MIHLDADRRVEFKVREMWPTGNRYKNSSVDDIANVNVLPRYRTCTGQHLQPLNWLSIYANLCSS